MKFSEGIILPEYVPLLRRLVRLCQDQCVIVGERPAQDVPARIIHAFLTKACDSLKAVALLYKNDLSHEAQSQIRILFELRLSFDAFVRLLRDDPKSACHRVFDAMLLEKMKQQRATEFRGLDLIPGAPTPAEMEETEREIVSRYTDSEIKSMRRHGFSGLSVERRAKESGLQDLYNVVYRNFSRNVHSGDFMELFFQAGVSLPSQSYADFTESRNSVGCDVAFQSTFGITATVSDIFNLSMERRLTALACSQQQIRKSNEGRA